MRQSMDESEDEGYFTPDDIEEEDMDWLTNTVDSELNNSALVDSPRSGSPRCRSSSTTRANEAEYESLVAALMATVEDKFRLDRERGEGV